MGGELTRTLGSCLIALLARPSSNIISECQRFRSQARVCPGGNRAPKRVPVYPYQQKGNWLVKRDVSLLPHRRHIHAPVGHFLSLGGARLDMEL
jgi:hypothetical protein